MKLFRTVDEFLSTLPKPVRERVEGLRKIIRQAAPRAEETISYNMPLIQAKRNAGVVRRLQNAYWLLPKGFGDCSVQKRVGELQDIEEGNSVSDGSACSGRSSKKDR